MTDQQTSDKDLDIEDVIQFLEEMAEAEVAEGGVESAYCIRATFDQLRDEFGSVRK